MRHVHSGLLYLYLHDACLLCTVAMQFSLHVSFIYYNSCERRRRVNAAMGEWRDTQTTRKQKVLVVGYVASNWRNP